VYLASDPARRDRRERRGRDGPIVGRSCTRRRGEASGVAILRAAPTKMRALSARLGFDPDSRFKIAIGTFEGDDDEGDFAAARRLLS